MRIHPLLPLALLAACESATPTETARPIDLPPQQQATTERGSGVLVIDDVVFLECVDEVVVFHAEVPFRSRTTTTPGGRVLYLEPFVPNTGTGTAVGQTSGTVWALTNVVSPLTLQTASDGATRVHFTATQRWVSETAPTMHLFSHLLIAQDADGNVTLEKVVIDRCRLQ